MFEEKINGCCPVETSLRILSGKYKSTIIWALRNGALRYGEIQELIPQASPKMLAEQLKELIDNDLISKVAYPVMPPKTEYSLTKYGEESLTVLQALTEFGRNYLSEHFV